MDYLVFISHSTIDTWVARQVSDRIKRLGATTFLDAEVIESGDEFDPIIFENLKNATELVVLLTPWAIERKYIWMEIGCAQMRGIRIVGVVYGLTINEFLTQSQSTPLSRRNLIAINDLDAYFYELSKRIFSKP